MTVIWSLISGAAGKLFAFASKPPGVYLAAGLAVALGFWYSGERGYSKGQAACEATHVAAKQKVIVHTITVYQQVADRSAQRTIKDLNIKLANLEKLSHVKVLAHADPHAADVCVPANVADGVRDLQ